MGECNWRLPDCEAGVWWTLKRRWRGVLARIPRYTLRKMFYQYSALFKGPNEGRKRWIRALTLDNLKPVGWRKGSWPVHAVMWQRIHERAGAFLDGRVADPCDGEPIHTGGRIVDAGNLDPKDFRLVNCGNTGDQQFWERRR